MAYDDSPAETEVQVSKGEKTTIPVQGKHFSDIGAIGIAHQSTLVSHHLRRVWNFHDNRLQAQNGGTSMAVTQSKCTFNLFPYLTQLSACSQRISLSPTESSTQQAQPSGLSWVHHIM